MPLTPEERRKRHADYMREYCRRTGCQKAAYDDPVKLAKHPLWGVDNMRKGKKRPVEASA